MPLVIALMVLRSPHWQPVSDIAQVEMRVRDVLHGPLPQIGLGGRFVAYGEIGSHPGALVFYLLAPVYWLFGSNGWGLLVSTGVLTGGAIVLAIWMGYRRAGWQMALLVTAMLALLFRAYGAATLLEPWTPYLVIVWWVVFLLAVWSVLCRDWPVLPVAVLAGSLCVQTHVGYAGIVLGTGAIALLWGIVTLIRHRGGWRPNRWVVAGLAVGVVVWLPTVIEQFTHDPGNVTILVESFRHPYDERVELSLAFESWLAHLNPVRLFDGSLRYMGSGIPGLLFLAVWAGAVFLSWRRRDRDMLLLHGLMGVATVLGLVAMTRVYGILWSYLVLWAWGTSALMLLAVVWTGWRELPEDRRSPVLAGSGVATLLLLAMFAVDATDAEMTQSRLTAKVNNMVGAALARLADDPASCGDDCQYRVTWSDPRYVGGEAYGLMLDLERHGITAGTAPGSWEQAVRSHRVVDDDEVDATLHVAVTDEAIEASAALPGAEQVAYVDAYTPEEQAANDEVRAELVEALEAEGFGNLVGLVADDCRETIPILDEMSSELKGLAEQVNGLVCPSALFLFVP